MPATLLVRRTRRLPEMKEIGVGDVKDDRMARAIGIVIEGS